MKPLRYLGLIIALSFAGLFAKDKEWKDIKGTTFQGTAVEALGPLALFGVNNGRSSILVPFSILPPEACVQFYEDTKSTPARAADWAQAKSDLSSEIVGNDPRRLQGSDFVKVDFAAQPEPLFYVAVYVSNGESKSWDMLGKVGPVYTKLHGLFPREFDGILFGIDNSVSDQKNMASSMKVPYLVADPRDEASLHILSQFAPVDAKGGIMVLSRTGVALFARDLSDPDKLTEPLQQLGGVLDVLRPDNPKGWKDRAYYLHAVQPVAFARGHSDPILVGNPLRADGLRERKVYLVDAMIDVAADGHVTHVAITPDPKNTPAPMVAPLASALQKSAVFVAAVQDGKFVDGTYHYRLEVSH